MGIQQPTIQTCGYPFPASFMQMLASCLMVDEDGDPIGFNVSFEFPDENCDCTPLVNCDNNHIPPENLLVLGFGLDNCGRLAIKLVNCDGTMSRQT